MPSKGISVFSYISPFATGCTVQFSIPGAHIINTHADNFTVKTLELEPPHAWDLAWTGRFAWKLLRDGEELTSRYNDINPTTGNLKSGTMFTTLSETSVSVGGLIVTFGFYDAGTGVAGLTSKNHCYVTVKPDDGATWMGRLAPEHSAAANKPFSRFVLAAPHDPGMNNLASVEALLNGPGGERVRKTLLKELGFVGDWFDAELAVLEPHLTEIVMALAVTQKDHIATLLNLGARYFEFRPAYLHNDLLELSAYPDKLWFQHLCIPGLMYDAFLADIVSFLDAHPTEIVIVRLCWDGVLAGCKRPSQETLDQVLNTALSTATHPLHAGNKESFQKPISALRAAGERLILLNEHDGHKKYDSYLMSSYATLVPQPILQRLEGMSTEGQQGGYDYTVLQCQGTSNAIKEVVAYSVLASNASTSPLTETKAAFDRFTIPWVRQNALPRLKADQNIVIMNDWMDAATIETATGLSQQRLAAD